MGRRKVFGGLHGANKPCIEHRRLWLIIILINYFVGKINFYFHKQHRLDNNKASLINNNYAALYIPFKQSLDESMVVNRDQEVQVGIDSFPFVLRTSREDLK